MTAYDILWIAWIIAFFAIEIPAMVDRRLGDTLSEHIWKWFRVGDSRNTPLTWFLRVILLAGLIWLLGHLGFGIWTV